MRKKWLGLVCAVVLLLSAFPVAAAGGTTYYVSAAGTGDGLSEASPMSFAAANALELNSGDRVLLRRGDVFYGTYSPKKAKADAAISLDAYGSGALPVISRGKTVAAAWTSCGNGFWKFDIVNGSYTGVRDARTNIGFMKTAVGEMHGARRSTAAECTEEYDFYTDDTFVYVKSSRDPYQALGAVTFNTVGSGVELVGYMTVQNIRIVDCGYGMTWKTEGEVRKTDVTIRNCVIEDIGGQYLDSRKAGNGIEFWCGGTNCLVENNIIRNCYDVAVTCQGSDATWQNVVIRNNVFAYNTQALEIWSKKVGGSGLGVKILEFSGNLCINNGQGWAYAVRPDKTATDILAYEYEHNLWDMTLSGNVFYHDVNYRDGNGPYVYAFHAPSAPKFLSKSTRQENRYFVPAETDAIWRTEKTDTMTYAQFVAAGHEKNGSFYSLAGKTEPYQSTVQLSKDGMDCAAILTAARTAGLLATPKSDSSSTTTTTGNASPSNGTTTTTKPISAEDSQPESDENPENAGGENSETERTVPQADEQTAIQYANHSGLVWVLVLGAGVMLLAAVTGIVLVLVKGKAQKTEQGEKKDERVSDADAER